MFNPLHIQKPRVYPFPYPTPKYNNKKKTILFPYYRQAPSTCPVNEPTRKLFSTKTSPITKEKSINLATSLIMKRAFIVKGRHPFIPNFVPFFFFPFLSPLLHPRLQNRISQRITRKIKIK